MKNFSIMKNFSVLAYIYIYIVILFYRNASFVIPFYKLILQSELKGVPILDTNSNDTVVLC